MLCTDWPASVWEGAELAELEMQMQEPPAGEEMGELWDAETVTQADCGENPRVEHRDLTSELKGSREEDSSEERHRGDWWSKDQESLAPGKG